jgi:hypothetical protein
MKAILAACLLLVSVTGSWNENRLHVLMRSVAEQSDLILHNMSAHPFPNHLADAALGKLLTMNATTQATAIHEAETILQYMFDKHTSFGLSFGGVFAAPMLRRYGHLLSPATHRNLTASLYEMMPKTPNASAPADVSYNNIYLMNAGNLILIGEVLMELEIGPNAENAIKAGYAQLLQWLEYAYSQGIHEFTSPTYTWVQFEGMYPIYLFAKVQTAHPPQRPYHRFCLSIFSPPFLCRTQHLCSK